MSEESKTPEVKCGICSEELVWSHAEGTPWFVLPCNHCHEGAINTTWEAAKRLYCTD